KEITSKTKNALTKAMQNGAIVILASGRPTSGVVHLADELELEKYNSYILPFNGGKVINCKTKETVIEYTMNGKVISDLYDFAKERNINIVTYQDDCLVSENTEEKYATIEANVCRLIPKKIDNFKEYVNFPVTKCLMMADGDYLANFVNEASEKFSNQLTVFRSEPYFLEFMPKGIDKATSLDNLLKKLNLTKEELICCGDGYNDISMIDYAGLGVAMENAREEVKAVANIIAGHNDEDGLVPIIEEYLL
ncbi:MAG: Cof-type HAD-IIB family hydrolase, partial [Clostridia bacterium]